MRPLRPFRASSTCEACKWALGVRGSVQYKEALRRRPLPRKCFTEGRYLRELPAYPRPCLLRICLLQSKPSKTRSFRACSRKRPRPVLVLRMEAEGVGAEAEAFRI